MRPGSGRLDRVVTEVEASAPGKLVLVGEYAVLYGGTALSAAVDTRAYARIESTDSGTCELRINNSGDKYSFSLSDGVPQWREEPGHLGLLLEIALEQIANASSFSAPLIVTLCTRDFYTTDEPGAKVKMGTGSSAALAVALTSALQSYLGQTPDLGACESVHRKFQGGKGSGIDVLTSWYGGVVSRQSENGITSDLQIDWLEGLHVTPVWTGHSASTPDMLDRLTYFREQSPESCEQLIAQLRETSAQALSYWVSGSSEDFLKQIEAYAQLLKELDAAAQIGIWSDVHLQLEAAAQTESAVYKPSGAGGGDYGLLYSTDEMHLRNMQHDLKEAGFISAGPDWTRRGMEVGTPAAVS